MKELLEAAAKGDLNKVKELIAARADIHFRADSESKLMLEGEPALVQAVRHDHVDVVQFLLKEKANPNDRTLFSGGTPLNYLGIEYAAIEKESKEKERIIIIQALLQYKADVNAVDAAGVTLLMRAAYCGSKQVVETLLAHKALPNLLSRRGESALTESLRETPFYCKPLYTVKQIIDGVTNPYQESGLEMSRILLKAGADINQHLYVNGVTEHYGTPLIYCIQRIRLFSFRNLIRLGADVNKICVRNMSPLFYIFYTYRFCFPVCSYTEKWDLILLEMSKTLIASGAIIDRLELDTCTTLSACSGVIIFDGFKPFKELAQLLSAAYELFKFARQYHRNSVNDINLNNVCSKGASFSQRTVLRSNTPLHEACFLGNYAVAFLFMRYIDSSQNKSKSLMSYIIPGEKPKPLKPLSFYLSLQNKHGQTPLDEACIAFQNNRITRNVVMDHVQSFICVSWLLVQLGAKLNVSKSGSGTLYDRLIALPPEIQFSIFSFLGFFVYERPFATTIAAQSFIERGMHKALDSKIIPLVLRRIENAQSRHDSFTWPSFTNPSSFMTFWPFKTTSANPVSTSKVEGQVKKETKEGERNLSEEINPVIKQLIAQTPELNVPSPNVPPLTFSQHTIVTKSETKINKSKHALRY